MTKVVSPVTTATLEAWHKVLFLACDRIGLSRLGLKDAVADLPDVGTDAAMDLLEQVENQLVTLKDQILDAATGDQA